MAKYLYDRAEYARLWKLVISAFGIAFLIAGAIWSGLPDWDLSISLVMALLVRRASANSLTVFRSPALVIRRAGKVSWYIRQANFPEAQARIRGLLPAKAVEVGFSCGIVSA